MYSAFFSSVQWVKTSWNMLTEVMPLVLEMLKFMFCTLKCIDVIYFLNNCVNIVFLLVS